MWLDAATSVIGNIRSNSISAALAEKSQVRLAALSGIEIAYERLSTNPGYAGEMCVIVVGINGFEGGARAPLGDRLWAVRIALARAGQRTRP